MKTIYTFILLTFLAAITSSAATLLINGQIHTVSGEVISKGQILFEGDTIREVGKNLKRPEGVTVVDAKGAHVYPGLIASTTAMGLVEVNALRQTRDYNEVGSYTPDVFAWIAINPDSELLPVARANGITHFLPVPTGGTITGYSGVIASSGWTIEEMATKPLAALHLMWPRMSLRTQPRETFNDPSKWKPVADQKKDDEKQIREIHEFLGEARAYLKAKEAGEGYTETPAWEAMIPALKKELPVIVHADSKRQIESALQFGKKFDLRIVIAGGLEADRLTNELVEQDVPVIYEHTFSLPQSDEENYDHQFTAAQRLSKAGVKVAISMGNSGFDSALVRNLPYSAAQCVAYGLDPKEALKMITLNPAQILGVGDQLGSIEPGKNATFFLSSGDILDIRHNPTRMWINGKEVSLESRHTKLYKKYKARPQ